MTNYRLLPSLKYGYIPKVHITGNSLCTIIIDSSLSNLSLVSVDDLLLDILLI